MKITISFDTNEGDSPEYLSQVLVAVAEVQVGSPKPKPVAQALQTPVGAVRPEKSPEPESEAKPEPQKRPRAQKLKDAAEGKVPEMIQRTSSANDHDFEDDEEELQKGLVAEFIDSSPEEEEEEAAPPPKAPVKEAPKPAAKVKPTPTPAAKAKPTTVPVEDDDGEQPGLFAGGTSTKTYHIDDDIYLNQKPTDAITEAVTFLNGQGANLEQIVDTIYTNVGRFTSLKSKTITKSAIAAYVEGNLKKMAK